jgi:hypothetical protein
MLRDRENRDPFGRKPAISPGGGAERLLVEQLAFNQWVPSSSLGRLRF